jgi:hypothetical protein
MLITVTALHRLRSFVRMTAAEPRISTQSRPVPAAQRIILT